MRRYLAIFIIVLSALAATGATPRWESVDAPPRIAASVQRPGDGTVDVAVNDGYVYIASPRQVQVKVFTILGQLISQETIPVGCHRLRISARGVYILKIGESTIRITI